MDVRSQLRSLTEVGREPLEEGLLLLLHEEPEEVGRHVALQAQRSCARILLFAAQHFLLAQRVAHAVDDAHQFLHLAVRAL